jgi:MFS transporter, SP family, xylose:H+ symportor
VFLDDTKGVFAGKSPWPIFAFFAGFMLLQLLFTLFMMPETKGRTLEELEDELVGK